MALFLFNTSLRNTWFLLLVDGPICGVWWAKDGFAVVILIDWQYRMDSFALRPHLYLVSAHPSKFLARIGPVPSAVLKIGHGVGTTGGE
jgi:hypothetical protein